MLRGESEKAGYAPARLLFRDPRCGRTERLRSMRLGVLRDAERDRDADAHVWIIYRSIDRLARVTWVTDAA